MHLQPTLWFVIDFFSFTQQHKGPILTSLNHFPQFHSYPCLLRGFCGLPPTELFVLWLIMRLCLPTPPWLSISWFAQCLPGTPFRAKERVRHEGGLWIERVLERGDFVRPSGRALKSGRKEAWPSWEKRSGKRKFFVPVRMFDVLFFPFLAPYNSRRSSNRWFPHFVSFVWSD